MRALYGVPPVEEHRDAGDQLWRVIYVDGYGRDVVLVTFVRTRGRDPAVWVQYPQHEGAARIEPLEGRVPQQIWNQVRERARHFDRTFKLQPEEDPAIRMICLHGWVSVIEAVERRFGSRLAGIRRKTERSCEDGPGTRFAWELQQLTVPLFPHCAALDREQHRNAAMILDACRFLHGDRLAAAEVFNLAAGFRFVSRAENAHRIAGRFASETTIDWNGDVFRGHGYQADEFWVAHIGEGSTHASFFFERVEGETGDRVIVTGGLTRSAATPQGQRPRYEQARVRQVWVRDINGDFLIEQAFVGPWEGR